jgi:hypothetical protein
MGGFASHITPLRLIFYLRRAELPGAHVLARQHFILCAGVRVSSRARRAPPAEPLLPHFRPTASPPMTAAPPKHSSTSAASSSTSGSSSSSSVPAARSHGACRQLLRTHILYSASHGHLVGCPCPSSPSLPTVVLPASDLPRACPNALLGRVLLWYPCLPRALALWRSSWTSPSTHAVSTMCSSISMIRFPIARYLRRSLELLVVLDPASLQLAVIPCVIKKSRELGEEAILVWRSTNIRHTS